MTPMFASFSMAVGLLAAISLGCSLGRAIRKDRGKRNG